MSDEAFAGLCDFEAYRASGPGGQKRNKTSSAVRLTHRPTGLSATATESRSQHDNRRTALRRLRHRVVLMCREAVDILSLTPPTAFDWSVSQRAAGYLVAVGYLLDVFAAARWSVSDAARALRVSTANVIRFLQADHKVLAYVNAARRANALKPLGAT